MCGTLEHRLSTAAVLACPFLIFYGDRVLLLSICYANREYKAESIAAAVEQGHCLHTQQSNVLCNIYRKS
jgi:hypothetical protein